MSVRVDLIDRLPTPHGLVRGGVAPDHQKIKSVAAVYDKVAADPRARFFGNVKLGADVSVEELRARYDRIVYAFGCESDKRMGVPGEELPGSRSATEFVGWYNGHPDHQDKSFDLSCEAVAVVGIGNVAMDVTRLLACDPESLAATDISAPALEALRRSRVRTVWLLGRRGPAEAAYSPAEIEEIGELPGADLVVDPAEAVLHEASTPALADPVTRKKVEYVQARAGRAPTKPRQVRLRFLTSPVEVLGEGGRVVGLRIERNRLEPDPRVGVRAVGTGEREVLPVGLVLRSVGYRGVPVAGVPFDEKAGRVAHSEGRVAPGEYVVGWAKRGPSGLIGTNRADSAAVVALLLADLASGRGPVAAEPSPEALPALLAAKGVRPVSLAEWRTLDALERERGRAAGKAREKFVRVADMLAALDSRRA